jgi:hypothetical protein
MNLPLRIALLSMIAMISASISFTETQKLSSTAQAAVNDKLRASSTKELLVFNQDGSLQTTYGLDLSQLQQYDTLPDLLKSHKSPIADCKHPVPTPPPGCVICENGRAVCNKSVKFLENAPESVAPNKVQPQ